MTKQEYDMLHYALNKHATHLKRQTEQETDYIIIRNKINRLDEFLSAMEVFNKLYHDTYETKIENFNTQSFKMEYDTVWDTPPTNTTE